MICVGNFTLGGSGKTPAAIAIARLLTQAGGHPALLSRGYGGSIAGPIAVDPSRHGASEIGDEALLLARAAPTFVAHDRLAGARAIHAARAGVVVMDDGLQNATLHKDFTIAVIDGKRGLGNGMVFPAGPLRAPLDAQWPAVDAVLAVGIVSGAMPVIAAAQAKGVPVFHAALEPDRAALAALNNQKILAFAGIGDPEKFFATLATAGIDVRLRRAFGDHHRYTAQEAAILIAQSERAGLTLVTTEKDVARMTGDPRLAALATHVKPLPVTLVIADEVKFRDLILAKIRD